MYTAESNIKFAICIMRDKTEDLDLWKIYRVLSDTQTNEVGCLRVIYGRITRRNSDAVTGNC